MSRERSLALQATAELNGGKLSPRAFACAGRCLPEVVTVHEQIRVFQCNCSGNFTQHGSTDSAPRDDTLSVLIKKKNSLSTTERFALYSITLDSDPLPV